MILRPACLLVAAAGLAACSDPTPAPAAASRPVTVQIADGVCRPSAPGRRMALCYLTLTASAPDALVSASSPQSARVALHDVPFENGMVVLVPRSGPIGLPAGQAVRLAPGGQALALQGLDQPLTAGRAVTLDLTFNAAPPARVVARTEGEPAA